MGPKLPDKLFFRIGEVAHLLGLKPSVLRFWESEFTQLRPRKSGSGQRVYSRADVELLEEIQRLLHRDKMTIEGARQKLARRGGTDCRREESLLEMKEVLRSELLAIRQLVS
jgi:DNA-binding transcriptional MerR regulator